MPGSVINSMASEALVCAVCGSSGFLADKVSFFPFVIGVALGVSFPSRISEKLGFPVMMTKVYSVVSKTASAEQTRMERDDCSGLNMADLHRHDY